MGLGHEKLDVYRLAIGHVAWVYEKADGLTGNHRSARDQWLRASPSIPLDIAEGQNRKTELDRMAAMLSRLGGRGYQVRESGEVYSAEGAKDDPDSDSDLDETKPQQNGGGDGRDGGLAVRSRRDRRPSRACLDNRETLCVRSKASAT